MSEPAQTPEPGGHCRRRGCPCTHTDGCDYGWVPMPPREQHGITYEQVAPCPVCRPDAADRLAQRIERESRNLP